MGTTIKDTILQWLRDKLKKEELLTNWHLNYDFIEFWGKFFNDEKATKKVQQKFTYYANILVKEGILDKASKMALGRGAYSEFGVKTQTIWTKKGKSK